MNEVLTLPSETRELRQVRNVLGVYFPKVDFNCSTDYKHNYHCIVIRYTDGTSLLRVKNAVKGFELHPNPEIHKPGVKVIVKRIMSDRTKKLLLNEIRSVFAMKTLPEEDDWFEPIKGTIRDYMDKVFNMRDF